MRYITASEIGQFLYCRRQWSLDRKKKQSGKVEVLAPTDPRAIGIDAHQRHAEKVEQATQKNQRLTLVITIAALTLLAIIAGTIFGRLV
jgi:hypothetical protein